jgi:hypothetical protein
LLEQILLVGCGFMENAEGMERSPVVTSQPPRKRFHVNVWYIITAVLVIVIVVQGFLYLSLNSSYNTLDVDHKSLEVKHQDLRNEYDNLTSQHSALQSELSTLQGNYDSLQTNYTSLQDHYGSLQSDYNSLQSDHDSYVSSYSNLRYQINQRTLQFGVTDFITPDEPSVQNRVNHITGGWSNTSDWNEYWNDIKTIYDWVINNVEYRSDGLFPVIPSTPFDSVQYRHDMWQLPRETLELMKGDCEDMATLLASMILSYNGGKYWVECIAITNSTEGHVAVQIPVSEGKLAILDPAGKYYTQTIYGSITSKDISTEISNWLSFWESSLGSNVYVDRVFSNHLNKYFFSTSEYTSWMYDR